MVIDWSSILNVKTAGLVLFLFIIFAGLKWVGGKNNYKDGGNSSGQNESNSNNSAKSDEKKE